MRPGLYRIPAHAPGKRPARRTTIWDQCGADNPSQTPRRSLECAMEGWRDDWVALPGDWSSTDPGGIHQQPVLMSSLWGGSGPRHPRDAQSPHRITPRCLAVPIGPSVCTSSGAVTPDAAQQPGDGAPPGSSAARWRVNSRDWAGRLGLPRLVTRPYANHWRRQTRVPSIADLRWRPHPRGGPGRGRFGSAE